MPKRVAAIDLGTNSVRLDIVDLGKKPKILFRDKVMVRLGQNVFEAGKLDKNAVKRTLKTLAEYSAVCEANKVDEILAFGTSALRTAGNTKDFLKTVKSETGLDIDVISGKEEAELIYRGICQDRRTKKKMFAFIDIGGGSTEVGVGNRSEVFFLKSFKLGAARVKQNCESLESMRGYVKKYLSKVDRPEVEPEFVLGSSGTIKTLREVTNDKNIKYKSLRRLSERLASMSAEEIALIPGVPDRRADILLSGAVILEGVMKFFGTKEVRYTKFAMRDGIVEKYFTR